MFELGNCAATLLILRASELFRSGRSGTAATELALFLYVTYNLAAALISVPAGRWGDRVNPTVVLAAGAALFTAGYLWFAAGSHHPLLLAPAFILAGLGIGCAETAEHTAVATLAPANIRGSAFGVLATTQAAGNLLASVVAGVIWSATSPRAAFVFLATAMAAAVPLIVTSRARSST